MLISGEGSGQAQGDVMRRLAVLLLLVTGCSTAPVADLMDYFKPGRIDQGMPPYGGVCQPRQIVPPSPGPAVAAPVFPGAGPALPGAVAGPPPLAPAGPQGPMLPAPDFNLPPTAPPPAR